MATPVRPAAGSPVRATGPLSQRLVEVASVWARSQHEIVVLAAAFAHSGEWALAGSPTPAHWLAGAADVEVCTAREWVRVGHKLQDLPIVADAFGTGRLSYSKVRAITRIADATNEAELTALGTTTPAGDLGRALAAWVNRSSDPEDLDAHHQRQRSAKWRTEPDGMVTFTLRLTPLVAGMLIAWLTTWVMRHRPLATDRGLHASTDAPTTTQGDFHPSDDAPAAAESAPEATAQSHDARPGTEDGDAGLASAHPTLAQQHADAVHALVTSDGAGVEAEVIVHVRGDGCSLDDGTPLPDSVVERIAPQSFLRALVHDADSHPINASGRQRHPNLRQKRVVRERDRVCRDCGSTDLLEYDHVPAYETTGRTLIDDLQLRCAPCHRRRHAG